MQDAVNPASSKETSEGTNPFLSSGVIPQ
jgi:hypothetical protein